MFITAQNISAYSEEPVWAPSFCIGDSPDAQELSLVVIRGVTGLGGSAAVEVADILR